MAIHIKPENKGKFNATKKRTGKTTEELTHSKNPLTRKRAIFAQNAKKWKHQEGGIIAFTTPVMRYFKYQEGGVLSNLYKGKDLDKAENIMKGFKERLTGYAIRPYVSKMTNGTITPDELKIVEKYAPEIAMAYNAYGDNIPYDDYTEEYTPSEEVVQSLMNYEQFLDRPSKKLDGHWTIGYGDTDKELNNYYLNHPNEKYTREAAEKRLRERLTTEFANYGKKYTPNWNSLSNPQKDSLVHYIYNIGPTNYRQHRKLFEAAKKLDFAEMAKNIDANYNDPRYPGLKKRRDTERAAFLHPETTTFGTYRSGGILKRR